MRHPVPHIGAKFASLRLQNVGHCSRSVMSSYPNVILHIFPAHIDISPIIILNCLCGLRIRKFISGGAGNGKQPVPKYAIRGALGAPCTA
jgi:hypothetical protein